MLLAVTDPLDTGGLLYRLCPDPPGEGGDSASGEAIFAHEMTEMTAGTGSGPSLALFI